jgi:hypothetical protein
MFFTLNNRIEGEINTDANKYKSWWNGITEKMEVLDKAIVYLIYFN